MASSTNMPTDQKPTLKTIAKISGLAVPTVSRALSNAPDIGEDTKKLVREIADTIGYIPNRAGVRLRTGRTNVIALALTTEVNMMSNTARLIAGLAKGLQDTQYHLVVTPYFPDEDPLKAVKYVVETRSADAIILNQTKRDDERIRYLLQKNFPFATHGRTSISDAHPYFDYDNYAYCQVAVETLARRDRRKVYLIAPPATQFYGQNMIDGTRETCQKLGIEAVITDQIHIGYSIEDIKHHLAQALANDPTIDAIICGAAEAAIAATAAIEDQGKQVGVDIDVAAKEAIPFLKVFRPKMIVLSEDVDQAGLQLARAALRAINEPNLSPLQGLETPDQSYLY